MDSPKLGEIVLNVSVINVFTKERGVLKLYQYNYYCIKGFLVCSSFFIGPLELILTFTVLNANQHFGAEFRELVQCYPQ
jgi:hypothetical protein